MEAVIPRLYASAPEPLPFGPSLEIRAFLAQRDAGNLLMYRSDTLRTDAQAVTELGGISRQYLNHRHEASPACDWVAETFGAPLTCHEQEAESVSASCRVEDTFSERHVLDGDFEVIPTPGHTSGASAFLWDSGEHRCLFTGDTILFDARGDWVAAVLSGSDRERYVESLELIRGLDFDVLVPSVASAGQPLFALAKRADAQRRVDAIIERLRRGESR